MARKNNRRGCRQLGQDVIDDILSDGVRKHQTDPGTPSAAKNEPTEADQAYANAVEVCDRINRELDEQLED